MGGNQTVPLGKPTGNVREQLEWVMMLNINIYNDVECAIPRADFMEIMVHVPHIHCLFLRGVC